MGKDAALTSPLATGALAPLKLIAIDRSWRGGCVTIMAREQLRFDNSEAEITRVLRYWIEDARFVDCWLYAHD